MAIDPVPGVDTSCHSVHSGPAVPSQDSGNTTLHTIHSFSKHDTIKLTEANFLLWKHQLLLILEGYDLEGFVQGTIPIPSPLITGVDGHLVDNPLFLAHKKQDKFLASWLLSTVSDDVLVHLTAAKTSFDIWSIIEKRFGLKSNIKVSRMRHDLYSLKKANLTVKEYLSKVSIILVGLSMEFESIRVIASATPMSLDLLTEMLLDCEARQLELLTEILDMAPEGVVEASLVVDIVAVVEGGRVPDLSVNYVADLAMWSNLAIIALIHSLLLLLVLSLLHFFLQVPQSRLGMDRVSMGNGASVSIAHIGFSSMMSSSRLLHLKNILHVPTDIQTGTILLVGHMHKGLYRFDVSPAGSFKHTAGSQVDSPSVCHAQLSPDPLLWHNRLGHPCNNVFARVLQSCNVSFKYNCLSTVCSACQLGKSHKLPFSASKTVYPLPFELVVSDVWGPAHVKSNGFSYYVSFVDMHSRYTWLYFIKAKSEASMSVEFWSNAFSHAIHVVNKLPTYVLHGISPYEMLYKVRPDYSRLRVFGCACFPSLQPYNQHKLQFRSRTPVDLIGQIHQQTHVPIVSVPALVIFSSGLSVCPTSSSSMAPSRSRHSTGNSLEASDESCVPSSPPIRTTVNTHPMLTRSKCGISKTKLFSSVVTEKEPISIQEAFQSLQWTAAAQAEYQALLSNHTWDLMPLPVGRRAVGCKWISKVKRNDDGSVARYKGRLVVKGYLQEAGINFHETFSPVVKPTMIRVVLAIAVSLGWSLRQVDVNNAFLNGDLSEEIYMVQPLGFEQQGSNGQQLVCRLRKALYGLKQAPRAWFHKLREFLLTSKFETSKADNSLFIQRSGNQLLYVLVYVDDIIVTGSDSSAINQFVKSLHHQFSLKDLGKLNYFLGIEVTYTTDGLVLNQKKYILDLLKKASMDKSSSSPILMVSTCRLSAHAGSSVDDKSFFRSIVGALQYVVITRPDIAFSVNKVCQFMHRPLDTHFKAVKRILRYLQGTLNYGLHFHRTTKFVLEGYSDLSWGSDIDDRRSTSGYCIFFGGNPISWSSRKQQVVSRSVAEAEYRSLANVTAEMVWLQALLSELSVPFKHVELDIFFVREKVAAGALQVGHVSSADQVADVLTKPLSALLFTKFRRHLQVAPFERESQNSRGNVISIS
ncbi:hypothetical protein CXB51_019494 [Gossypium anomalum]|uniref:Retrovirus-related Pol polyprotein from transposon RE1 n=1 Tax=Gossypium anomalum TaxID=47600 RepID=A0A8J5YPC6_9ROSI|nr:hypothetical protein CXB51_019494 [Gossypium anomalum]